jgi:putative ribosome biogenesis GTPase RsgA
MKETTKQPKLEKSVANENLNLKKIFVLGGNGEGKSALINVLINQNNQFEAVAKTDDGGSVVVKGIESYN